MYLNEALLSLLTLEPSWLLFQLCRYTAPLQGGLIGMEKEALADDSCHYSRQQKAAYTQEFSTRPRAGKQQAMGNAWLAVPSTKKIQAMLFHYAHRVFLFITILLPEISRKKGRPTCKHQIISLVKSRAHVSYDLDPFAIFSLSISEYYKPGVWSHLPASYQRKSQHCRHWTE